MDPDIVAHINTVSRRQVSKIKN